MEHRRGYVAHYDGLGPGGFIAAGIRVIPRTRYRAFTIVANVRSVSTCYRPLTITVIGPAQGDHRWYLVKALNENFSINIRQDRGGLVMYYDLMGAGGQISTEIADRNDTGDRYRTGAFTNFVHTIGRSIDTTIVSDVFQIALSIGNLVKALD